MTMRENMGSMRALLDALANQAAMSCSIVALLMEKGLLTEADEERLTSVFIPRFLSKLEQEMKAGEEDALAELEKTYPEIVKKFRKIRDGEAAGE